MKSKKIIGIGITAVIIAVIACFGIKFYSDAGYYYELVSYNEKGKPKTVKFGTEKELKEGAFICLTVKSVQGVVDWKEVQYNELPQEVQTHFTAPQK